MCITWTNVDIKSIFGSTDVEMTVSRSWSMKRWGDTEEKRDRERERMNVPTDNEGLKDQFMNEKFIQFQIGCEDARDPTACYSLGEW